MKLQSVFVACLVVIGIAGCVTQPQSNLVGDQYRFEYLMKNHIDGVIRAFDDGQRAIVQFVDLTSVAPTFVDSLGQSIAVEIEGQYAMLPSLPDQFSVNTTRGTVTFQFVGTDRTKVTNAALRQSETTPVPVDAVITHRQNYRFGFGSSGFTSDAATAKLW